MANKIEIYYSFNFHRKDILLGIIKLKEMVGGRHFALLWILSDIDWRVTEQKSRTNGRKEVHNL